MGAKMNYRLTVYPAIELTSKSKEFLFDTAEQMVVSKDTLAYFLLFLQDEANVMPDYSNCFLMEENIDGEWEEYDEYCSNNKPKTYQEFEGNDYPQCEILPKTKRLKQVIKEFGNQWFAVSPIKKMQCFDNALGVQVRSKCGNHNRNVRYPSQILFY